MAANDPQHPTSSQRVSRACLSAAELAARLDEETARAERHRTALSCLLVSLDDVERLARAHGEELPAQALAYLGRALAPELRRFDRVGYAAEGELLVVLPGADEQRAEIVARRALGRLRYVKIDVEGERQSLRISIGISAWRMGLTSEQLLSQTRIAAQRGPNPLQQRHTEPSAESRSGAGEQSVLRRS